jgi:uncharacterized protein (TIGR02145 family)
MRKLLLLILTLCFVLAINAQVFRVNTGAHLLKNELQETNLETKIREFGSVIADTTWIGIKQQIRRNNEFIENRTSICRRNRIELAGKMSRLLANQDIEGLRKQLEDKRASLALIPENLKRSLETNAYRGNFVCIKTPLQEFTHTISQQISSAQVIMAKTAIAELNGAFIKSLTSVTNGLLEERTVRQWISGNLAMVGQPFYSSFSSDQRFFILASTVEVSPLKEEINSGNLNFGTPSVEFCFNLEMNETELKSKLLETGILSSDADKIISELTLSGMTNRVREFNAEKERLIQNLNRSAKQEMEKLQVEIAELEDKITNHDRYLADLAQETGLNSAAVSTDMVVRLKNHILERMKLFEDSIETYAAQRFELFESSVTVTDQAPKEMARSAMGGLDQLKARKAVAGYSQYIEVKDGLTTDFKEGSEVSFEREVDELWFLPRRGSGNTYNYSLVALYSLRPSTPKPNDNTTKINEVKIGNQIWMGQNLNVTKFRNGDLIPEAKTPAEWKAFADAGEPAWSVCETDDSKGEIYGKLYNWYAVNDSRGLAPEGWHIPSDEEWTELNDYLGGDMQAGPKMKSQTGWDNGGNGTNSSGFNAIPSGYRGIEGNCISRGIIENWWSSTESNNNLAWKRGLGYSFIELNRFDPSKGYGFSVRCVKGNLNLTAKKMSETVKIGGQTWMAKNLDVVKFRNGDIIPEAKTAKEWAKAAKKKKPAWCYYNNDSSNNEKLGKLYNHYAVMDPRGLAPIGWHIPKNEEWKALANSLGAPSYYNSLDNNNTIAPTLKSKCCWTVPGNNNSVFTAMPGGYRSISGDFSQTEVSSWYSSFVGYKDKGTFIHTITSYNDQFKKVNENNRGIGASVRCVSDNSDADNDGIIDIRDNCPYEKGLGSDGCKKYERVIFKNETYKTIYIAVAFFLDDWESNGWYKVESQSSFYYNLPEGFNSGELYYYAINYTGDDEYFCIHSTDAFRFTSAKDGSKYNCKIHSNLCNDRVGFSKLQLNGKVYTLRLTD